jgi:hypothetical protein
MAANRYAIKPHDTTDSAMLVMSKPRKKTRVPLAQGEKDEDDRQRDEVVHIPSVRS